MQKEMGFVAMADVLGFKKRHEGKDALELANEYKDFLREVDECAQKTRLGWRPDDNGIFAIKRQIEHQIFSDTLLLWDAIPRNGTSIEPFSYMNCMEFIATVHSLILIGLKKDFPLRIGVAYGEYVIDPNERIYLGKALVDAHLTESCQEWMGMAYHTTAIELFDTRFPSTIQGQKPFEGIHKYRVPLKPGKPGKRKTLELDGKRWTINWPSIAKNDRDTAELENRLKTFSEQAPDDRAKKKWKNTLKFFNKCITDSTD
jgi:hypothetical protein